MPAMVKLAKEPLEPQDIDQPTPEWREDSRPVQGGEKDTEEGVMMPHTEMCEKSENREEGYDVERVVVPQNDETAGILKQSKDEMSAYLTALEKKRLDRKTNPHGLMKAETQPRSARSPPWTDCESRVSLWMRMRRTQTDTKDPMRSSTEANQWCGSQPRTSSTRVRSKKGW